MSYKSVSFYGLETNGEALASVERAEQIATIAATSEEIRQLEKLPVLTIVSSRGMGKTFLMKKGVLDNNTEFIKEAKQNGRVVSIECGQVFSILKANFPEDQIPKLFWPMTIFFHLHCLFAGKRVVAQDQIYDFRTTAGQNTVSLESIKQILISQNSFHKMYATLEGAYALLLKLTNAVWQNNTTGTIFLLDEINCLTQHTTLLRTDGKSTHTYLSFLLDQLHNLKSNRPLCICAGTTDGDLPLVCDGTHVRVIPLRLTTISMEGVWSLGQDYFNWMLQHSCTFSWPQSIEEMHKDHVLIAMIYHSFQVPRLLKLAVNVSLLPLKLSKTHIINFL